MLYARLGLAKDVRVWLRTLLVPLRLNKCINRTEPLIQQHTSSQDRDYGMNETYKCTRSGSIAGTRMELAFGAKLMNEESNGVEGDVWFHRWRRLVSKYYSGSMYDLPSGNISKQFVGLLADEIMMLSKRSVCSERVLVYCRVILQRDQMIKMGSDIRLLVKRRLEAWKNENFDGLVQEAIRCTRQTSHRSLSTDQDHIMKVFTRLMLRGELRAATRWITERGSSKVLSGFSLGFF